MLFVRGHKYLKSFLVTHWNPCWQPYYSHVQMRSSSAFFSEHHTKQAHPDGRLRPVKPKQPLDSSLYIPDNSVQPCWHCSPSTVADTSVEAAPSTTHPVPDHRPHLCWFLFFSCRRWPVRLILYLSHLDWYLNSSYLLGLAVEISTLSETYQSRRWTWYWITVRVLLCTSSSSSLNIIKSGSQLSSITTQYRTCLYSAT